MDVFVNGKNQGTIMGSIMGTSLQREGVSWENQTMGKPWENHPEKWRFVAGKIIELKAELSSKPCLMKPEGTLW